MISINIDIRNPWSKRWRWLSYDNTGRIGLHKAWEFNTYASHSVVHFMLEVNTRCDHAGVALMVGLFGYTAEFQLYDVRHWDHELGKWAMYPQFDHPEI